MLRKHLYVAVVAMGGLVVCGAGCLLPVIEGAKAAHVAVEGEYDEITPVAAGVLAKYKGYKVGSAGCVVLTADASDENKEDAEFAQKVAAVVPERFDEYMVNDAKLQAGAAPALLVTVRDIKVIQRHGVIGTALPQAEVVSVVTLADAGSGKMLGVAKVYGHTSSRVLRNPRQLANFICRGTAKWISEKR